MPTYGYRCDNHHQFEAWQPITDPPLTVCPQCHAPLHRVFYPVGIVFKGQGFYKTDSRPATGEEKKPAPAKEGEAGTPAAETKPTKPKPDKPAERKSA